MKKYKFLTALFLLLIFVIGCTTSNSVPVIVPTVSCDQTSTPFQTSWTSLSYPVTTSPQNLVQEYTFSVNTNKTVCTIGYQGSAVNFTNNTPYTIEIYNNTTNTSVYSGSLIFNSASVDYKTITPTNLIANQSYTIRRIASNANAPVTGPGAQSVGTWKNFTVTTAVFPLVSNGLTITGSKIYNGNLANLCTNCGLPFIDIVFQ